MTRLHKLPSSKKVPIDSPQTMLALNQLPAYHSPLNFPSPMTFDPTRFLPQSSTTTSTPPTYPIFQPFALGRHQCIGYKFAWAEMRLVLARLLWAFELVPCAAPPSNSLTTAETARTPPEAQKVRDFGAQKTYLVWEKEPLWVRLRERDLREHL
jgi:cytochrome P450